MGGFTSGSSYKTSGKKKGGGDLTTSQRVNRKIHSARSSRPRGKSPADPETRPSEMLQSRKEEGSASLPPKRRDLNDRSAFADS